MKLKTTIIEIFKKGRSWLLAEIIEDNKTIHKHLDELDKNQCKAILVEFLCDIENGIKKDEVQIKLAYDVYDRYTKVLNCNSYIHDKWEKLKGMF